MNTYQSGTAVSIVMPYVDATGSAIVPLSVSYRILDELENVVVNTTVVTLIAGSVQTTIVVPASVNVVNATFQNTNDGANSGNPQISIAVMREIELKMQNASGIFYSKVQYIVKNANATLVLLQNSFQTFNLAILTGSNMPNIDGWNAAADNDKIVALQTAWLRLTRLGYFVRWPRDPDAQNYLNWYNSRNEIIVPRLWQVMTTQRWYAYYPEAFRQAMRSAQVAEADQILQGDIIAKKRKEGLFSEKIGESSVMFRAGKPLDMGISREALEYISGYVDMKLTITRH